MVYLFIKIFRISTFIEILNILEGFPLGQTGQGSADTIHLMAEAEKLAFADRSEYLGDPDFVKIPVAGLLDRTYLARLMKNFDPAKATPSEGLAPGNPVGWESIKLTDLTNLRAQLGIVSADLHDRFVHGNAAGVITGNDAVLSGFNAVVTEVVT